MVADPSLGTEFSLLYRVIRWTDPGITWEPDHRHVELIVQSLHLEGKAANTVVTPGNRESTRRSSTIKAGEECLCAECDMVHAYGVDPVSRIWNS